jgi:hypothetical protein
MAEACGRSGGNHDEGTVNPRALLTVAGTLVRGPFGTLYGGVGTTSVPSQLAAASCFGESHPEKASATAAIAQ